MSKSKHVWFGSLPFWRCLDFLLTSQDVGRGHHKGGCVATALWPGDLVFLRSCSCVPHLHLTNLPCLPCSGINVYVANSVFHLSFCSFRKLIMKLQAKSAFSLGGASLFLPLLIWTSSGRWIVGELTKPPQQNPSEFNLLRVNTCMFAGLMSNKASGRGGTGTFTSGISSSILGSELVRSRIPSL